MGGTAGPGRRSTEARAPGDPSLKLVDAAAPGTPQASPRERRRPANLAAAPAVRASATTGSRAGPEEESCGWRDAGRRPPLAPPGQCQALRLSAAARAGELGGQAGWLRLQLRHPLGPGDLRAGRLGSNTTPGCCSFHCPRTAPTSAPRLRPGELRARPPQASAHCDASRERTRCCPGGRTRGGRVWEVLTSPWASFPTVAGLL